jgi:hypothetical protein
MRKARARQDIPNKIKFLTNNFMLSKLKIDKCLFLAGQIANSDDQSKINPPARDF